VVEFSAPGESIMAKLRVTLIHGPTGKRPSHRETIRGLGFRKREETVEVEDNPSNRGMVDKIRHLIEVERVED
jgi:large subunit ribosomal protein L30